MLSVTLFRVACTPVVSVVLGSGFSEVLNRPSYSFQEYIIENASKLFATSILVLLSVCLFVAWRWSRQPKGPQPPLCYGSLPFIGHIYMPAFRGTVGIWELTKEINNFCLSQGGVIQFKMGLIRVYMLADPDDCYTVSNTLLSKPYVYRFAEPWLTRGLFMVEPSEWKLGRRMFNSLLSQRLLNTYMTVFNENCRLLADKFAAMIGKGKFRHDSYLKTSTLETAIQTTLGLQFGKQSTEGNTYIHAAEVILRIYAKRLVNYWLHFDIFFKFSSLKKKHDKIFKILTGITNGVIAKRKLVLKDTKKKENVVDASNDKFRPLVDTLLEVQEEEGLTDSHIREHVDTMIVGIYDTTANTLTFLLTLIGSFPRVQDRIYNELIEVLGDSDRDVDKMDLSKLVYTQAVIKETLRMYTIVPVIGRVVTQEVKLKNYTIPAGGYCIISLHGLNRHPMWGADADQFRPERWIEPGGVPNHPKLFAGFSIGKRDCIGKGYAMMYMKIIVAHIVRRYRVQADHTNMIIHWDFFLNPLSGHDISLELRT